MEDYTPQPEQPMRTEPEGMNKNGVTVLVLAIVAFVLGIVAKGM